MTTTRRGRKPRDMGEGSVYAQILAAYGVSLTEQSRPRFGAAATVKIAGFGGEVSPTYHRLAEGYGFMQWIEDGVKSIVRGSKKGSGDVLDRRFITASTRQACLQFEAQYIVPLRRTLETRGFYLYALPQGTYGQEEDEQMNRIVTLLPMTVEVASRYGLVEEDMRLLAPQVLHVVRVRTARGAIKLPAHLLRELDQWIALVDYPVREALASAISKSAPCLLTPQVMTVLRSDAPSVLLPPPR